MVIGEGMNKAAHDLLDSRCASAVALRGLPWELVLLGPQAVGYDSARNRVGALAIAEKAGVTPVMLKEAPKLQC